MSDIHNHILCGSESLALLKNQALHDLITAEYPLYKLGCMGGDIFYYYDFIGGGRLFGPIISAIFSIGSQ
jgi:hypothetical protein